MFGVNKLILQELVYEQIEEEFAYTMIALLCDIGGTLGLMMGASVLTVCELMEVAWSRLLKIGCKKRAVQVKPEAKVAPASKPSERTQVFKHSKTLARSKDILRDRATHLDLKAFEEEYFGELIFM